MLARAKESENGLNFCVKGEMKFILTKLKFIKNLKQQ